MIIDKGANKNRNSPPFFCGDKITATMAIIKAIKIILKDGLKAFFFFCTSFT
ncbi:MAG: hypothetical protein GW817_14790 [Flavobacteriales bacterium]|nr:hypothetical protein [Flavobacteriales bacterium]